MTNNILLQAAAKSDMAAVFDLEQQVFGANSYPDFFFRQVIDCWHDGLMLAKDSKGTLVGYQLAIRSSNPEDYWILSLAVSKDYRGQGIGRKLIESGLATSPDGVKRILLTVSPNNAAQSLYESCGFTQIGFEDEYFGPNEPRVIMAYHR